MSDIDELRNKEMEKEQEPDVEVEIDVTKDFIVKKDIKKLKGGKKRNG